MKLNSLFLVFLLCFFDLWASEIHVFPVINDSTQVASIPKENIFRRLGADAGFFVKAIGHTYARPFHWQGKQWLQFGALIGTSSALVLLDNPTRHMMQKLQTGSLDDFEKNVVNGFGKPRQNYLFTGAVYGLGMIINNKWLRDTGLLLAISMTASGLIQTYTKPLFGRARPNNELGPMTFRPFGGGDFHSLVSGHTVLATTTAWVLAHSVKPKALKVAFYTVGATTSISRLYSDAHWLTDVGLGAVLSIFCTNTVLRFYEAERKNSLKSTKDITWKLLPQGNRFSITGSF